jgi:hypothetical protein
MVLDQIGEAAGAAELREEIAPDLHSPPFVGSGQIHVLEILLRGRRPTSQNAPTAQVGTGIRVASGMIAKLQPELWKKSL